MAQEDRNVQMDRVSRALARAHNAGDTESARALAGELRRLRDAAPNSVTVNIPQQPQDDVFLEERGLTDDDRARSLYEEMEAARASGDPAAERRSMLRLSGYLAGRDAVDDQAGGESRAENVGSRAETALRGFGQGVFGAGDFAAAMGSWLGSGGPFGDFSLRDSFAFERARREGMQAQNPVTGALGYVGGAATGGGAVAGAATRLAGRAPGAVGQTVRNVFQRRPGSGNLAEVGRSAAGAGTSGAVAATLEGGDAEDIRNAALLGAVGGPVAERALEGAAYAGRGLVRRGNTQAAADAALRRRMLPGEEGVGRQGAQQLAARVNTPDGGRTILEAANEREAMQLGEEASLSPEAFDEFRTNLTRLESARAPRVRRRLQGDVDPTSSDDVRAAQQAEFEAARRTEARAAADEVEAIRRQGVEAARAQRGQNRAELSSTQRSVQRAEERLRDRLVRASNNRRADVTPEFLRAERSRFGDDAMGAIGDASVTIDDATNFLSRPAFRAILRRYAGAADPEEAAALRDALNTGDEAADDLVSQVFGAMDEAAGGVPLTLTARQIDAFRRAADTAGQRDPELAHGLTEVADRLNNIARDNIDGYGQYLDEYAALSRRIEGAERGFQIRGAQPSRLEAELALADEAGPEFREGLERAGQRAVADQAAASPRAARQLAEQMVNEPRRFELGMGRRAQGARATAEGGLEEIRAAEEALEGLRVRQQADAEELRDLIRDQQRARTQRGQERIQMLRDRMEERRVPMERAEQILNVGTENFGRAARMAGEQGTGETFRRVARTALAEGAGEGADAAASVSARLARDDGLQRRVRQAFGDQVADDLIRASRLEAEGSEAVRSAAAATGRNAAAQTRAEREFLTAAVDAAVVARGNYSGSFGASALLRIFRLARGDEQRAIALARALTADDPEVVRRTLARLEQLGASVEQQKQIARAAGVATGIYAGQSVADGEDR